jgi:hypothetical protein
MSAFVAPPTRTIIIVGLVPAILSGPAKRMPGTSPGMMRFGWVCCE